MIVVTVVPTTALSETDISSVAAVHSPETHEFLGAVEGGAQSSSSVGVLTLIVERNEVGMSSTVADLKRIICAKYNAVTPTPAPITPLCILLSVDDAPHSFSRDPANSLAPTVVYTQPPRQDTLSDHDKVSLLLTRRITRFLAWITEPVEGVRHSIFPPFPAEATPQTRRPAFGDTIINHPYGLIYSHAATMTTSYPIVNLPVATIVAHYDAVRSGANTSASATTSTAKSKTTTPTTSTPTTAKTTAAELPPFPGPGEPFVALPGLPTPVRTFIDTRIVNIDTDFRTCLNFPDFISTRSDATTTTATAGYFACMPSDKGGLQTMRDYHHALRQPPLDDLASKAYDRVKDLASRQQYAKAMEVCEHVLRLLNPKHKGCLFMKGEMLKAIRRFPEAMQYLRRALVLDPRDTTILIQLGKAQHANKDFASAVVTFDAAINLSSEHNNNNNNNNSNNNNDKNSKNNIDNNNNNSGKNSKNSSSNNSNNNNNNSNVALLRECQALKARSLFFAGQETSALALVQTVLRHHSEHELALEVHAELLFEKKKYKQTLQTLLRLVVLNPNDKNRRALMAKTIDRKDGIDMLEAELNFTKETAAALAFIGLILKDYSVLDKSIDLYRRALNFVPSNATYAINHVYAIEASGDLPGALHALIAFLKKNPHSAVHDGKNIYACDVVLSIITARTTPAAEDSTAAADVVHNNNNNIGGDGENDDDDDDDDHDDDDDDDDDDDKGDDDADPEKKVETTKGKPAMEKFIFRGDGTYSANVKMAKKKDPYPPDELDLLGLFYAATKLMFLQGHLANLPRLINYLAPSRPGRDLHLTTIRNEQAYFANVQELVKHYRNTDINAEKKIYMVGDTNALVAAWQRLRVGGVEHVIHPIVVTGLKMWHLRDESVFYPKTQFLHSLRRIPHGAVVIFVLGETDCREGIYVSVEKGKYSSMTEAAEATIRVFLQRAQELRRSNGWQCFIHPVPPVLNETRFIVSLFNTVYERMVKEEGGGLAWLDILPSLLDADGAVIKKYVLDGTHLGPAYVPLIEHALAQHTNASSSSK